MSILDKALGAFGLQRAAVQRSARPSAIVGSPHSYAGAAHNRRFSSFHFGDNGPNAALTGDLETLRARSRQFYRDHPWVKAVVDKLANQVIGDGRKPRFSGKCTLSEQQKLKALDLWNRVVDQIDATRTCDFYGMQDLAAKSMFRDGEVFGRFRRRRPSDRLLIPMQLQLMEADQLPLTGPGGVQNVIAGVEIDGIGAPIAYHFLKSHPRDHVAFQFATTTNTTRVPFDEVAHLFYPNRAGQRRGEPLLHAVIVLAQQLQVYQEAELDRKGLVASFGGTIKNSAGAVGDARDFAGAELDTVDEEIGSVDGAIEPNTIFALKPGEEFVPHKSDDIPQSYAEFYRVHGHQLAANAWLTYGQTTGDYADSSYSSERAGENCVRRMQTALGKRIDFAFNMPTWREVIRWGFQIGFLEGNYADAEVRRQYELVDFNAPAYDWIDPLKDAEADEKAEQNQWVSKSHNIRIRGGDPDEVFKEIAEEQKRMKALGIEPPPVPAPGAQQAKGPAAATPPARRGGKELVQ